MVGSTLFFTLNSTSICHQRCYNFRDWGLSSEEMAKWPPGRHTGVGWGRGKEQGREAQGGKAFGGQDTSLEGERGTRFLDKGTAPAMTWLSEKTWHPGRPKSLREKAQHQRPDGITNAKGLEVKQGGSNASRIPNLFLTQLYHSSQISTCYRETLSISPPGL